MMRSPHPLHCARRLLRYGMPQSQRQNRDWRRLIRKRLWRYGLLSLLILGLTVVLVSPLTALSVISWSSQELAAIEQPIGIENDSLSQEGRILYEAGRYSEAIAALEQAIQNNHRNGNTLAVAIAQSNLSLAYQALGRWQDAEDAIQSSLSTLRALNHPDILAQVLDVQGQLQFGRGEFEQALLTWEESASLYRALNQDSHTQSALVRNSINQAEALQTLGLYRRAIARLDTLAELMHQESPSSSQPTALQAKTLRSLGDALRVAGELDRANAMLQESLAIAEQIQNPDEQAATHLSLGNVAYAQSRYNTALNHYQQSVRLTSSAMTRVDAQVNQIRVLTDLQDWASLDQQLPTVSSEIDTLPLSRPAIFARINLAQIFINTVPPHTSNLTSPTHPLTIPPSWLPLAAQHLAIARQQSQELGDRRIESFAVGTLGELYETVGQWKDAQSLAEEALRLAQQINATDMSYLWQWQLGRVHKQQGERNQAIAAYKNAIAALDGLRNDLVAVNPDVQFSFRESVEPVHRELVSLLLSPGVQPTQAELEDARKTIESLQLAELNNFFREACLDVREVQIDDVDKRAAVIYPIILDDRLEVIISLPGNPAGNAVDEPRLLRHHANIGVTAANVKSVSSNLLAFLKQASANFRATLLSQQMYGWLIQPFEADLAQSEVKTVVFVLDGILRNIPMAALYDGEQYLIEHYSVALTPSLQLLESDPIAPQQFSVLLGGISESHQDFSALPGVVNEFGEIQRIVPDSEKLINQRFTDAALQDAIDAAPFPVVHLATHGQFSSSLDDTFILTWGDRLNVNELNQLLQATDLSRRRPIELLVLSACETAEGDDRAALGLAGVAVRAGARSTVATLWQLNDETAPLLMERFYRELASENVTKAEALRRAQRSLLDNPQYNLPYFWSPMVLIGNWL